MDPNATMRLIISACQEGDLAAARQHQDDYRTWVLNGGFLASTDLVTQAVHALDALAEADQS